MLMVIVKHLKLSTFHSAAYVFNLTKPFLMFVLLSCGIGLIQIYDHIEKYIQNEYYMCVFLFNTGQKDPYFYQ